MVLNLTDPGDEELRAKITVFGVGGAGGNAVNNMIEKALPGVDFIAANTDSQALKNSQAPRKIQMGSGVTRGLGAGSKPEVGLHAAEETIEEIADHLDGCHMCFITAGMGGGTGTGAAPVVARTAREMGILTVGVVTKPFHFEGNRRMAVAEAGVEAMQSVVDTLIVIPNQNLFQVASERTTFVEAFHDGRRRALSGRSGRHRSHGAARHDQPRLRRCPKSVMEQMGKAMMGTGEADGDTRAIDAAEKAIANPLLDEVSLKGARGVLINITGGYDLTLFEMDEAANRIKDEVDPNAMIKFGSAIDPDMEGKMRVSVVATGIDAEVMESQPPVGSVRRKPVATDPGIVAAARGGARRPDVAAEGFAEMQAAAPQADSEPEPHVQEAAAPHEEHYEEAEAAAETASIEEPAAPPMRETVPEAAQPAPEPERPRRILRSGIADERRYATAPSPEDIRARAEEVRQRALQARARRTADTPQPVTDEEHALFDIDEGSISPGAIRAEGREQRQAEAEPERAAPRAGLFTINKLIHRVAGQGAPERPQERPNSYDRPESGGLDDDEHGDIPAFLRRQAN